MSTQHLDEQRIEEAQRELGTTQLHRPVAWLFVAAFLGLLAAVPILEWLGRPDPLPGFAHARLRCSLRALERRLDEDTRVARALRPYVQTALLRVGAGNVQVVAGRDGWLFQREAIAAVTGPSFLAADVQRRRYEAATDCSAIPHPDALAAVLAFHRALEQRGVSLLLAPTPAKVSVAPERFSSRFAGGAPKPHNPGFAVFVEALRAEGVRVLDPEAALRSPSGEPSYLATDTHWRPKAVEAVAELLAEELLSHAALSPPTLALRRERTTVTNRGDVAGLLGALPSAVPAERVEVRPVVGASGEPWRPDPEAEVLLLGDSFSNIYSDRAAFEREGTELHWGSGAGLAEQLSFALQRPVDRIVRNDDGAFASRFDLARAVAQAAGEGRDRLGHVRAVVWQFAERELAFGDWRPLELAAAPAVRHEPQPLPLAERRTVRATIAARAPVPEAGSTPYPDALFAVHLVDVEVLEGAPAPKELVVYLQGLKGHRLTAEAGHRVGARVTLDLVAWDDAEVQGRYAGLARTELDDDAALLLPAFWGETNR